MRIPNHKSELEVTAAIRRERSRIDEFITHAKAHGPIAAATLLADAAFEAETVIALLSKDATPDAIRERAIALLIDGAYVFGHAHTKDAERRAARKVIGICDDAISRG